MLNFLYTSVPVFHHIMVSPVIFPMLPWTFSQKHIQIFITETQGFQMMQNSDSDEEKKSVK